MSTCCWCTPGGSSTVAFLKRYAAKAPPDDFRTAEEDLCYCLECVAEYHRARDELPFLHEVLWELETLRLINHFEKSMKAEIGDNDELYIVDNNGEAQLFDFSGQDFENKLRVPLLEILKYPYLLLHERVNELCVEALCRMEQANCSFQVFDKHPGIYLFLVHPNEMVRRWAILTARNLGKVDRDDYYDLQEVLTCLFKVIELGLLESPDIYTSSVLEKGKLILLPSHMYDTTNYKNYWLGICMLLTILEEQAMDSLLLGSDKQNDFMQSILHTMERQSDDDSMDPFWPALHCFMVILDRLGSKVWGQLIDPIEAFQTIINNVSYNREIQNIRSSSVRTKLEPESYLDDMVTCSQIVYSYNPEKTKKDAGWRSAICPDYCPNMYEEMETLANVLQSDIGQDMRVHNSTFLWFIPFVQSLMDLKDLGVAYIVEVIHHLHSEVKDVLNQTDAVCDKVTEFFLLILVSVIELHKNKKCLHLLWVSSQQWVEAVVKCAKLPTTAFARSSERSSGVNVFSSPANSVQLASVHLILSLLKEGYQLGQQTLCKQYQDKLNGFIRQKNLSLGCQLTSQETHELQTCLKQIIRNIKFKVPQCNTSVDPTPTCKIPSISCKEESDPMEKKCKKETRCLDNSSPTVSKEQMKADGHHMQENVLIQASSTVEDNEENYMTDLKQGDDLSVQSCLKQNSRSHFTERARSQTKTSTGGQKSAEETCSCNLQKCSSRNGSERGCDVGVIASAPSVTDPGSGSLGKVSPSPLKGDGKISKPKTKAQKDEICAKLSDVLKKQSRRAASVGDAVSVEEQVAVADAKSLRSRKDAADQSRAGFWQNLSLVPSGFLNCEKRELENEELDSYTSHGNKCENQESPVGKNLGCCAELRPTSVNKTSPFRNCVTVRESGDKDMNKSADVLLCNLAGDQGPGFSPKSDILTDSQVDRDLHKLSLIAQASVIKFPSDSTQRSSSPLQRKVKDDKRRFKADQDNAGDHSCGQVIIISDSDDEEEERLLDFEKHKKQDKKCIKVCPEQSASVVSGEEKLPKGEMVRSLLEAEGSESQLFEFESESEVYSAWQETKPEKIPVEQSFRVMRAFSVTRAWDIANSGSKVCPGKGAKGMEGHTETQKRDVTGEECREVDIKPKRKRLEKPVAKEPVRPSSSTGNEEQAEEGRHHSGNHLESADERTVTPDSSADRATVALPRKPPCKLRTCRRGPRKTPAEARKGQNRSLSYLSCRTTPAVVPPKKFRQCPEPTSTVERLGLKKAPRRAFELSQRSLDSLVQLRDHGKTVGVVETRKKSKLIAPQTLSVRNNKKLLVCQDVRLRRQVRPKSQQNVQGFCDGHTGDAAGAEPHTAQVGEASVPECDMSDNGEQVVKCTPSEPETLKANSTSQVAAAAAAALWNQCDFTVANERVPAAEVVASTSEEPVGGADLTARGMEVAGLKELEPECGSDADETLFLTQNDPEDMDLCSQMETFDDQLIEVIHGAADSGSELQSESGHGPACEHRACAGTTSSPGEHCARPAEAGAAEDGVFRKPALPAAAKPLRPSTRKIFTSSSTSRIANLSKSLENTSALRSSLKNKPSGRQSLPKEPLAVSAVSSKPMVEIQSLCNVGLPQVPNNPSRQRCTLPFGESRSLLTSSPTNTLFASQSLSNAFVNEILKWKYEMFLNFDQCGPPASLCQSISRPVPVRFQDCEDYFNIFLPLMILNTFETVAQEWISSPNKENFYQLHLRKFPGEQKKYREFVVYLEECELAKQLHPKENDLVFLVPEQLNEETEDGERNCVQDLQKYHCGYVHKFRRTSVMRNGKSECSLSIQTQDDLPGKSNEIVKFKCVVISSLVTTQRKLKAMSLLSGRNQLARAVLKPCSMDFCMQELPTMSSERIIDYLRDFNEDQKKAIETAHAMVKHLPSVAKICLIHGPPGTGKSKTIVGLLYCLLTENQRKGHPDENFNAKIKQNRVLVCAPSNAAVDELMKKIILEFKEKCKDKKNPLGNCGDINLVRLGPEKSINNEVLKFSLDSQVNHRMKKELPSHVQEMHRRKEFLDRQLDELSRQRALCRGGREAQRRELDEKIARVSKERQELASKIKEVQGRPQKTQNIIILESHIICCTLSTSGGLLLESAFRGQGGVPFSCVIVDEAGQSCEVETLTPLIHRCNKLILVGDPKQLPPTVISMKAQEYGYDQSMMARFYKLLEESVERNMIGRLPILQLTVQYRMHPDICLFPSNYVYNRSLKTSRLTETSRCSSDWPFQPYLVFDVGDGSERRDNDSYVNIQEIKLVMEIIKLIKDKKRDVTFRNIGIITHYKAQKTMIQKDLDREFDRKGPAEVDTVDAFQGRQKDCVIVTCVRANALQGSIGFLASLQRLNVTITRAKYSLFILGHLRTLMENPHWNHLIQDAQKRGAIIKTCDKNYRHDAMKILKLKPVFQRSLSHPLAAVPEAARPQGGLPSSALDSGIARTSFASSLYHTLSDTKVNTVTPTVPERLPGQEQLRDPRLLRRMATEAKGALLQEPQPVSPQHPGATPPSAEPGFPVARQDASRAVQQAAGRAAALSTHRLYGQGGPPGAGPDAVSSRRRYELEGELGPQREARAFGEDRHERYYTRRASSWDRRRWEKEESGPKRRKL
ncbi:probable helicase senataxin [Ochotona princeps]|uniref:probable helicase senataxin n=1 Tax=Ochotona princeps TaxID=9978 RepID=UPI0027147DF5|nr:probable helicase senataxin [Ochotona princeps]XP_058528942.1 probable helicase senataxin [Ochotona princeps]